MKKIPLTQGKFAIVDDEDFEWLNQWTWYGGCSKKNCPYYVKRLHNLGNGEHTTILMGRQILGLEYKDGRRVKYINKDTFDNRKNNLKIVTMMSSKEKDIFHSKYLG